MPQRNTDSILTQSEARFLNRETSWLAFNQRVLEEALNARNPLYERINFLAISAANLDEFTMVRVAGLKEHIRKGSTTRSIDGKTPEEELEMVHKITAELVKNQHDCWLSLKKLMQKTGLHACKPDALNKAEAAWLEEYFAQNIFPVLTPIALDPAHPFPFLPNLGLALAFQLRVGEGSPKEQTVIVPLPHKLPRFIFLSGEMPRYVMLEDAIEHFLPMLMPGFTKIDSALFRIIRDSDLEMDEDSQDFVNHFERAIKKRRRGRVIQVKFMAPASERLLHCVAEQMQVPLADVMQIEGMLGLSNLSELVAVGDKAQKFPIYTPRFPERITDYEGDCFAAIAAKDIVIHHPFETFDVVVQFLRQAARDAQVVSIKQTLYRTSQDSPIVKALIEAAEAGKSVTALVELKARFDEEANIQWARDLEAAGAQVVYGFVSLKTHAKVTLVTRKEEQGLKSYVHFGTGNYHPKTAQVYTDLSFFTCDTELCRDAAFLFNFITGYAPPKKYNKLIVAPRELRKQLLLLIDQEIEFARAGKPASIWAKMNALVDPQMIDALYRASGEGVMIELVVRGVCCLRPAVPGLSEHIRVKSLIGRFLEHSRIFCFGNGEIMPGLNAKVFISSADWMPRNLNGRVEAMVPIENPTVHEQILGQIMMANLKDEAQSWILQADGSYIRLPATAEALSAHEYFMNNPSLSGRGRALKKARSGQMLGKKRSREGVTAKLK